ncbi:macro domain-containing protein (plasmid) [Paenibacillus thiaminolyticus]|uniref:macro domain-containing protein n=1 Tax=Paenibacillus thiaminolyticus TaxID=49283 RepID=UPI00233016EB|nr:macro domain-containing protein [Paenibacillus thiaminolyticus]WCF11599.1 macro domain-containing protein [Paenibacillus thiaminolyticus]
MRIDYGAITQIDATIIVNAANGIGFMGGWIGRLFKLPGVAESIHFVTKGGVESEARKKSRKRKWIPSIFYGHHAGEIYVTSAGSLPANWIIHAVTMRYPGTKTSLKIVQEVLPLIIKEAKKLNARSLAFPLLGAGTGGL